MTRQRLCAALLLLSSFQLVGCATIVHGRNQDLAINSNPSGAYFEIDGYQGITPAIVPIERKLKDHTLTVSKPGYETQQIRISRQLSPWMAGNLLWGIAMPVGFGVDFVSGSAFKPDSESVHVTLQPLNGHSMENEPVQSAVLEAVPLEP